MKKNVFLIVISLNRTILISSGKFLTVGAQFCGWYFFLGAKIKNQSFKVYLKNQIVGLNTNQKEQFTNSKPIAPPLYC